MRNSSRPLRLYSPSLITLAILLPFFAYYVRLVKLQEGYLNDRAFRVLEMAAGQFQADMNGVREAMGAANLLPSQFDLRRNWQATSRRARGLQKGCAHVGCDPAYQAEMEEYLKTYVARGVSEVRMVDGPVEPREEFSLVRREGIQPARIEIVLEENRTRIRVKLDPFQMLDRALGRDNSGLFETVFLATRDGKVIAARGATTVTEVETLLTGRRQRVTIEGAASGQASSGGDKKAGDGPAPGLTAGLSGANERVEIEVSGAPFLLFAAPAPFTLRVDQEKAALPVAFYGLARKSDIDSSSFRLPPLSVPAMISFLVLGMAFLWPALKLYTMSPKERLRQGSIAFMAVVAVIASLLVAGVYLLAGFAFDTGRHRDRELKRLAVEIRHHLEWEIRTALHLSRDLAQFYLSRPLPLLPAECKDLRERLQPAYYPLWVREWKLQPSEGSAGGPQTSLPPKPIRQLIKGYPFFTSMTITGSAPTCGLAQFERGEHQIVKLAADPVPTPLIALPEPKFPSVQKLEYGEAATIDGGQSDGERFALESRISLNTGEFLPIVMMSTSPRGAPAEDANLRHHILLATRLPSLVDVVFPQGYGFAVVDRTGAVLFHSDTSRNLRENFLAELADPQVVRQAIGLKTSTQFDARYSGRLVRGLVQPLAPGSEGPGIHNLDLALIVYYDGDSVQALLATVGKRYFKLAFAVPLLLVVLFLLLGILRKAIAPPTRRQFTQLRTWPWLSERPLYALEGVWGLFCCGLTTGLILFCQAMGARSMAVYLPLGMVLILLLCIVGFAMSWTKHPWVGEVARTAWWVRLTGNLPIATAYAFRIFGATLGIVGILSILAFHSVLIVTQADEENMNNRVLTAALADRATRNLAARDQLLESAEPDAVGPRCLIQSYYRSRFSGVDLYDERLSGGIGLLPTLRGTVLSQLFRDLNDSAFPVISAADAVPNADQPLLGCAPESFAGVDAPGPPEREAAVWAPLPLPGWDEWDIGSGSFFILGPIFGVLIFLWIQAVVKRLFILDFHEPDRLAPITGPKLHDMIVGALERRQDLDRILIFSNPRAGTGQMLGDLSRKLRDAHIVSSTFEPINFAAMAPGEPDYAVKFRERIVSESERSRASVMILDNFESRWTDDAERRQKLALLEALLHRNYPHLYLVTSVDPVLFTESLLSLHGDSPELRAEESRWIAVLASFSYRKYQDSDSWVLFAEWLSGVERELDQRAIRGARRDEMRKVAATELGLTLFLRRHCGEIDLGRLNYSSPNDFEESLVAQVRVLARGYYGVIWIYCTNDERLALYQLAKDNWMNPGNKVAFSHLIRKHLIARSYDAEGDAGSNGERCDGAYRLMNESFRQFVLETVEDSEIAAWEREEENSLWPSMRMALIVAFTVVLAFVSYVRRDIFDVYFSYFVALAGGGAALFRVVLDFFNKNFSGGGAKPS